MIFSQATFAPPSVQTRSDRIAEAAAYLCEERRQKPNLTRVEMEGILQVLFEDLSPEEVNQAILMGQSTSFCLQQILAPVQTTIEKGGPPAPWAVDYAPPGSTPPSSPTAPSYPQPVPPVPSPSVPLTQRVWFPWVVGGMAVLTVGTLLALLWRRPAEEASA